MQLLTLVNLITDANEEANTNTYSDYDASPHKNLIKVYVTGSGCSKLTSLVNVSLKFQTLISEIGQYFLLKKCEKLLQCTSFSYIFHKKYQCIWL